MGVNYSERLMDFHLNSEQLMMREMVRRFAEEELLPGVARRDEEEIFDRDLMFSRLGELGLTGMTLPESVGGAGADYLSYAVVLEELARVCPSTAVVLSVHLSLVLKTLFAHGSDALKGRFLGDLISAKALGAFALTESEAGSDAAALRCRALEDSEGFVLDGRKAFVTNGGVADLYLVFCRTADGGPKHEGISAFMVEEATPGFTYGREEKKMGIRASRTCELIFNRCRIPKENLLGERGQGFAIAMEALGYGRIGIAAQAVGIAQGALEAAKDYAGERRQFGRPLRRLQAVAQKLADMATRVEAARLLLYQAASLCQGKAPWGRQAAMAKLFASETASFVTHEAVQIHGGYGYTRACPVERMSRDARITEIYEGTSEIQRLLIARSLYE